MDSTEILILIYANSVEEMLRRKARLLRNASSLMAELTQLDADIKHAEETLNNARNNFLGRIEE